VHKIGFLHTDRIEMHGQQNIKKIKNYNVFIQENM